MKNFNFTPRAQKLIKLSCTLAENRNSSSINCLHFLLAFTKINQDQIEKNFFKYGVDKNSLQKEIIYFPVRVVPSQLTLKANEEKS